MSAPNAPPERHSVYDDPDTMRQVLAEPGGHRSVIGGRWDEIGGLQLAVLKAHGMTPQDMLLDVGCGSLRLGHLAVAYLDPGRYWGTDLNASLLDAGYAHEIVAAGMQDRLPRENLVEDATFAFPCVPHGFRFAVAQSVFTHLPVRYLRTCLEGLAAHMESGGTFLFTVFPAPDDATPVIAHLDGITSYADRDPFHHSDASIQRAGEGLPWRIGKAQAWAHPRGQFLVEAVRT